MTFLYDFVHIPVVTFLDEPPEQAMKGSIWITKTDCACKKCIDVDDYGAIWAPAGDNQMERFCAQLYATMPEEKVAAFVVAANADFRKSVGMRP